MTESVLSARRYEGGWLLAPAYDLTLILGVLALALISGIVVYLHPSLFLYVLLADLWLLGYHHVISTFTKLAGTKEDRRENRFLIYYLPFIVLAGVIGGAVTIGIWLITTTYFFWQWYHYVRQSYGIATFYLRRRGADPSSHTNDEKWLNNLVVWSVPVWGVLNRCHQGWDEFLFQDVWLPPVPLIAVQIAATVAIASFAVWMVTRVLLWHRRQLPLAHSLFVLSHVAAFFAGYIAIKDINIGWLTANIWHNAQYILFVWLYNTNRFKDQNQHKGSLVGWFSQRRPGRVALYFLASLLATSVVYGCLTIGFKAYAGDNTKLLTLLYVVSFQTINFHHYVVDSLIWKARHKKNQSVMKLAS